MNKLFIIVILLFISSCSRNIIYFDYEGEVNHSNFYMVDTIQITNPVMVFVKEGNLSATIYLSEDNISKIEGRKFKDIIKEPFIFLEYSNIYNLLDDEEIKTFKYNHDKCNYTLINEIKNLEIYRVNSNHFLMGLININHYNKKNSSESKRFIETELSKSCYYKVVFPICN